MGLEGLGFSGLGLAGFSVAKARLLNNVISLWAPSLRRTSLAIGDARIQRLRFMVLKNPIGTALKTRL